MKHTRLVMIIIPIVAGSTGAPKYNAVIGSMALCNKSTEPWSMYIGVPAKKMRERKKDVLDMEKEFFKDNAILLGGVNDYIGKCIYSILLCFLDQRYAK